MENNRYWFGENRTIPEILEPSSYFAYVDLIEQTGEGVIQELNLRLDCIQIKDLNVNLSQELLVTLPTILLNLTISLESFTEYYSLGYIRFLEGKWLKLTTKKSNDNQIQASYFGVQLANSSVSMDFITPISQLTREERIIYRNLRRMLNIRNLGRVATFNDLNIVCQSLQNFDHISVYDVGQGNLNGLCNANNMPLVYFDMGGGAGRNAFTYYQVKNICTTAPPFVILSHWDLDHIQTALLSNQSNFLTWYVPEQDLGLVHFILAYQIAINGLLLRVPYSIQNIHFSILKCTGRVKNDSGLALLINQPEFKALLPGDSNFRAIPNIVDMHFDGLIATHHASRYGLTYRRANIIPQATPDGMLAFSYGLNNRDRHDPNNVIHLYQQKGWSVNPQHKETPNGSIIMKFCPVNQNVPCNPQGCDLMTIQCY